MILLTVQVYSLHYYLFIAEKMDMGKKIIEESGRSKVVTHMTQYGSDFETAQKSSRADFVMSNEMHKI